MIDHPLPYTSTVEKAALSAFLQWPYLMDEHASIVEDHFFCEVNRLLFRRTQDAWSKAKPNGSIDLVEFGMRLHADGLTQDYPGIIADVSELFGFVPTSSNLRQHLSILTTYRARRLAIQAARALESAAFDTADDEFLDRAGEPITAVIEAAANAKPPQTTKQILGECFDRFEKRVKGEESPMGIATIHEIDEALRGLKPENGRVWVIGAYPSGGKSLIAGQILSDAALDGHAGLYLTMEMPERDLLDRCIIQTSRVPSPAFMDPKGYARENGNAGPTHGHVQALGRAAASLAGAPLHVVFPANRRLQTLLAAIRRAKRVHGIKIVAVDYLQLIQATREKGENTEREIANISHAFQTIAQELQLHILILSQLNNEGDTKHGRVIEEDADAFLMILQDRAKDSPTYQQHLGIRIAKDRHHSQGGRTLPLVLDRETLRFKYGIPEQKEEPKKGRFS